MIGAQNGFQTPTSTAEMTSPHLVPTVIAPSKSKGTELLEGMFFDRAGFRGCHFRWNNVDRGFLREVFPACFPMPLEELRWAERACRGVQSVRLPRASDLGFHLVTQRGCRGRTVILGWPRFVDGMARLLPFHRGGGNVSSFHAAQVLLSKLGELLVAEVEHGGLFEEKITMRLEFIDLPL